MSLSQKASAVTVGNFDGVHVGHRSIFQELRAHANQRKLPSVAVTFDPHPAAVLSQEAPPLLTELRDRVKLIRENGIDHCVILPFSKEMSERTAHDFISEYLIEALGMKVLCIGPTTHIGRKREGTPEKLKELSQKMGFDLILVPELSVKGMDVNSSKIREVLKGGDVELAARLLGRNYRTKGVVIKGDRRGRELGFPTANLSPSATLVPKRGVYATYVHLKSKRHASVTNVGLRPTFGGDARPGVETHLIGFNGDLAGTEVGLEWVARLRDERKFESAQTLSEQIGNDIKSATLKL